MTEFTQLVVFCVAEQRYALPLAAVEHIVWAAELIPLPKTPAIVLGAIDVDGRVLPVLDIRRRLCLPSCEMTPAHQFLISHTGRRTVVLMIDEAIELGGVTHVLPADKIADTLITLTKRRQAAEGFRA